MVRLQLNANSRTGLGKNAVNALRKEGVIPGVVYKGKSGEGRAVSISSKEFNKHYLEGALHSAVVDLKLGGKNISALVREIQRDVVSDLPIHVDFQEVTEKSVVKVRVPFSVVNHEKCIALKRGGSLNMVRRTALVECAASALCSSIKIDISKFGLGHMCHAKDLPMPAGVKFVDGTNFAIIGVTSKGRKKAEETAGEEAEAPAAK